MELADLVYIDATGYHFADYPAFLAWRTAQYQAIYGADVYLEADSQDGQLLAVQALADYQTAALGASVYNSFSPVTAQGVGLARNVKINGLNKRVPTHSTVDILITGQSGTIISSGVVIDTLEQKWDVPVTSIPGGGSITVTAVAQDIGAVNAEANTVNRIFTPTLGWQSVNNVAAAVPGEAVESDAAFRGRQARSTANPSLTVLDGSAGSVANLPGVLEVRAYENDTGSVDLNGIPAHSICMVVYGGDAVAIAQDIALHKTPGAGTFGNTTENVTDARGMPLAISFSRPTIDTITAVVTIVAGTAYSSDYTALIKQSIADHINSIGIGNAVLYTKMFTPAYLNGDPAGKTYDVVTIEIGLNADPPDTINIPIDFDGLPQCDPLVDVTVNVT